MFEGISGALQLAIIDMILVFLILGGLAMVMVILKKVVSVKQVEKPKKTKKILSELQTVPKVQSEKEKINTELIAVITAAVSACLEVPRKDFKIVKIKKYTPIITTPWSAIGRQEAMLGKNIKY